ncbi:YdeI/OmpD-associated family protein [Diaminobutyricibacter sp. McL0608]|uniref:YdeI/OmpD-associated family protein n=1 Tax=Leifsonia sp. McL0608 TaxID=3143537 RepID=UPI0031F30BA7
MRIQATVEAHGKSATGIEIPSAVVEQLGGGRRPPVSVTINGYTYRSSVASMGGRYLLGLSAEVRQNTGVVAGDTIDVDLELDTAPREVEVPADFAQALSSRPDARAAFDALNYSNKRRLVMAIDAAKAADTRLRRIEKTVGDLEAGTA